MKLRAASAAAALIVSAPLLAAEAPGVFALTNARIVTAPGAVLEKGTLVVRDGVIEAVGPNVPIPADALVRDLAGRTIYPGLIDPYVTVSRLSGKKAAPPDDDDDPAARRRRGATAPEPTVGNGHPLSRVHPEKSVLAELKVSKEAREALRDLGFTTVAAVPDQGIFRGRSAVLSLGDGPVSKTVLSSRAFQHIAAQTENTDGGDDYPVSKMGVAAVVRQAFLDAKWYRDAEAAYAAGGLVKRPERVEAWAALADAAAGKEPVVFETSDVLALLRAVSLAKENGLDARFVAAPDAYRLLDEVKKAFGKPAPAPARAAGAKARPPVPPPDLILTLGFPAAPMVDDDDEWADVPLERLQAWDRAPSSPRWLRDAGLSFALTTHDLKELSDLPARVKKARSRGLSADDLLAAFTTVPARMLGLASRIGEIAPGKAANLAVVDGTLFADKSRVVETWVDGVVYESKPPKPSFAGTWAGEGLKLEVKADPKTGALTAIPTPLGPSAGGKPAGLPVTKHATLLELELDGALVGLSAGKALAIATLDGESLKLDVAQGDRKVTRRLVREKKAPREGARDDDEKPEAVAEAPDSDVRPAPDRFASPLASPKAVVVKNATVWTSGPQGIATKVNLVVVDGKVVAVAPDAIAATGGSDIVEIDGTGKHVTPGLVDCHSHTAIDGNVNEGTHNITSEVRIGDVLDPFDVAIYRELAGGLTVAHPLHGSANAIGGQDAVIKLRFGEGPDGLPLKGAVPGIKFALGENPKQANWQTPRPRYPQTRMGVSALIRERFLAARDYRRRQKERPASVKPDLQLEAIAEILEGKRLIHSHAYVKQEMLDLIRLCEEFGVKIGTFQHTLEGYKIADEIAAHGAGGSSFSDWWGYKFEVYDAIPYNGALMRERGVLVSFNSDSDELARRMSLEAAKAVKYGGVPREEALKLVTINAAKQLRVDQRIGSLEVGKDGDFALWSGDPLDTSTICLQTWIEGRKYFDRDDDLKRRPAIAKQKADLVAKAKAAAARGEKGAGVAPPRRAHEGCVDEGDLADGLEGTEVTR